MTGERRVLHQHPAVGGKKRRGMQKVRGVMIGWKRTVGVEGCRGLKKEERERREENEGVTANGEGLAEERREWRGRESRQKAGI